jgi:HPt (histidine-containing phosphotransfer) domain-containing protein
MAPRDDDVLDPAVVSELRALTRAGDPELLRRLGASFARDATLRVEALRNAYAESDAEAAAFAMHTLRGSAATLGAIEVVAACRELERLPVGGAAGEIESLLAALEQSALRAQSALAGLSALEQS